MPHDIGPSLFAELDLYRSHLGNARCLHGTKLKRPCKWHDCMPEARALLTAEAGAEARAAVLAAMEASRG